MLCNEKFLVNSVSQSTVHEIFDKLEELCTVNGLSETGHVNLR